MDTKLELGESIKNILLAAGVDTQSVEICVNENTGEITANVLFNTPVPATQACISETKLEKDSNVIGSEVDVVLMGFNKGKPVTGKVDTGATISSLHAEDIKTTKDQLNNEELVAFKHNGIQYRMRLETHQAVHTADGGSEYRPVVLFDVTFQDKTYNDILFNLNNRGDMSSKLLLGKNFIEKGKFLIDATE